MSIDLARQVATALDIRSESKIRLLNEALLGYVRLTRQAPTTENVGSIDASQVVSGTFANARISEASVTQHQAALAIAAAQVTSGTFDDARIAESNVTQHEAALEITEMQIVDLGNYPELDQAETITAGWNFSAAGLALGITGAGGYISLATTQAGTNRLTGDGVNSVADDATITVPFGGGNDEGFVMVWTSGNGGEWFFGFLNPTGTLTAIAEGVNTSSGSANPDADGDLNVYPDGSSIAVKNRTGASRNIRVVLFGT